MENESEETYSALFRRLQERGLEKVCLCVSDVHKGLQAAIRNTLPGTTWQREMQGSFHAEHPCPCSAERQGESLPPS